MQSRSSDHETKPEDPEPSDPPAAVSNQNQEQAEAGHAAEGGRPDKGEDDAEPGSDSDSGSRPGAASEGSQATGHPQNAG
jgi:hypothetical protein